jgi:hypothetical protein
MLMPDRKYLNLFVVLIYTAFIVSIPWEEIQGNPFSDRANYLIHFSSAYSPLDLIEPYDIIAYVTREALWHFLMRTLIDSFGIPIEIVFTIISFLCLGVFSFYLVRNHGYFSLILLINPLVIDLAFSQLRMAFALSLLGFAYFIQRKSIAVILIVCTPFIHTAVVLFLFMYFSSILVANWADNKNIEKNILYLFLLGCGALIALAIGPLREVILSYLGDRRVQYPDASLSIRRSLFWMGLLIPMYMQARSYLTKNDNAFVIIILSLVIFNAVFSGYPGRFLAATFPMIISSILTMRGVVKLGTLYLFIIHALFQWYYWLSLYIP